MGNNEFNVLAIEFKNKVTELNDLVLEQLNSPNPDKNYPKIISEFMDDISKLSIRLHGR